jgi:diacylglycerol kinase family enzyme
MFELVTLAPLLRRGKQRHAKRMFAAAGRRIEIKTRSKMEIHADGEPIAHTPATFEVIPGALEVIAPRNADPQDPAAKI